MIKLWLFNFLTILICLLSVNSVTYAQDENFYIFLSFGQSNMEGAAKFEEQDTAVDERFQVLQAIDCDNLDRKMGQWYPAAAPITRCHTGLGPSDYFGRTLTEHLQEHIRIGIINVSVGGAKIELFEKAKDME